RIHSLAIEGHNRMCGIAKKADFVSLIQWRAPNGHERSSRILPEIFQQRRHQRYGIGEFFTEKSAHIVIGFRCGKAARTFEFPKQRTRERTVGVRQRDHHETFPWPDVERVFLHRPRTIESWGNRQFLVTVSEIALIVLESTDLHLH